MRRTIPALAAVLLTAACASTAHTAAPAGTTPAAMPPSTPNSSAPSPSSPAATSPSTSAEAGPVVVIPAGKLPYKPAAGAPPLGDVSVLKTAADPCVIPADDSGNEGQLINAEMDVNVMIVTFEFTNPCTRPVTYDVDVTQALGSATGKPAGPPLHTTTQPIKPGGSDTLKVNLDPDPSLTPTQLQQLWVGITHISKGPAN